MTRRNRQPLAPSLFPFLAVLVCTLGTLILLLALIVQNTATAAEQQARHELDQQTRSADHDPQQLTAQAAEALIAESQFRIEALESARDLQADELEQRRDQLTHLEDHIDRLAKDLRRLASEVESAASDQPPVAIDESALDKLRQQIVHERRVVEQLKRAKGAAAPRVVIVPHNGPNGTTRRPIYVECTSKGVTIWPEGVAIATRHLVDRYARAANPLDAALRVVRLHTMQVYGDADPPYPLLVVRPGATAAYMAATSAMDDWDDQYGYEMLDDGVQLAFSTPDANLKRRMEEVIERALNHQVQKRSKPPRALSAAQLDRERRTKGYGRPSVGARDPYAVGNQYRGESGLDSHAYEVDQMYRDAAAELRLRDQASSDQSTASHGRSDNLDAGEATGKPNPTSGSAGERSGDQAGVPTTDQHSEASGDQQPAGQRAGSSDLRDSVANQADGQQRIDETGARLDPATPVASAPSPLVQRQGQDWALPRSVATTTGIAIVRSIRIECHPDRFVVPATRGEESAVIPIGSSLDYSVRELATILRDRIDRWGVAINHGRWQPRLDVQVSPGAEVRFQQLRDAMTNSGIEILRGSQE